MIYRSYINLTLKPTLTVKDEEIREDALNLVNNLKHEMSDFVEKTKEKVSDVFSFTSLEEE